MQSAGFEKFKTVMSKVNSVINLVGVWLFRLRKFIMAAPVVYAAIRLASYNGQHLPEQVGLDLQSTGEFAMTVSRRLAAPERPCTRGRSAFSPSRCRCCCW